MILDLDAPPSLQEWVAELVPLKLVTDGAYGCVIGSMADELPDQERTTLEQTFARWR